MRPNFFYQLLFFFLFFFLSSGRCGVLQFMSCPSKEHKWTKDLPLFFDSPQFYFLFVFSFEKQKKKNHCNNRGIQKLVKFDQVKPSSYELIPRKSLGFVTQFVYIFTSRTLLHEYPY